MKDSSSSTSTSTSSFYSSSSYFSERYVRLVPNFQEHLISAPILAYPRFDVPFVVYMDASTSAVGSVLSQVQGGIKRVITY